MHTGRLNRQTLATTQLLAAMMVLNARDRISGNEFDQRMAESWLNSEDGGMASFETCCEHMSSVCELLSSEARAELAHTLGITPEGLNRADAWRDAFQQIQTMERVDQIGQRLEALGLSALSVPKPLQAEVDADREDATPIRDFLSGPSL